MKVGGSRLAAALVACAVVSVVRAEPIQIGTRLEMFVDRHLVKEIKGDAGFRLNPPAKREVVLTMDHPPEDSTSAYFTVFRDGEKIRMYYRGNTTDDGQENQTTCYAESPDGIHFDRPKLGLYEFNGSKENNICYRGPESAAFAPFKDDNPAAKADEKYKAICYRVLNRTGTVFALASPDGLKWHRMSEKPVMPPGSFDSLNTVRWDPERKRYQLFGRYWTGGGFKGVRGIQTAESDDFRTWSKPAAFDYGDAGPPVEHFYTNAVTTAPGAPHVLLSFPMRFVPERTKVAKHGHAGVSDAVFMASRDGVHWDRVMREPWVRPGTDERNWTERSNMPAWGIVETSPDEWSMYVSEHYRWPDNRLRRLTIPRGRFASIHAGGLGGEVVTKGFSFGGKKLALNYATSAVGEVKVAIESEGKVLAESEAVYGDELDRHVSWQGGFEIAALAGREVTLRFMIKDADVYAFRFSE